MIYKQPSGNAGEYYLAFFEMRLKVDSMIDLNTCSDSDFALFFHDILNSEKIQLLIFVLNNLGKDANYKSFAQLLCY